MKLLSEFFRFGVVGGVATLAHIGLFFLASRPLGLHPTVATTLAFCGALGVSYSLNRRWTFRATGSHRRQFPRFLLIALTCGTLNAGMMQIGVEVLGWSDILCLGIIIFTLPLLSFSLQRQWGFR